MLRFTRQADYAIVLMTNIAASPRESHTARELALGAHLPLPMVSKILKVLTREGLLASHRGVKGGYRLARRPAEVTVAVLVTAIDGPIAITAQCGVGMDKVLDGLFVGGRHQLLDHHTTIDHAKPTAPASSS